MTEAMVGNDDDVGLVSKAEFTQPVEHETDLAVIVTDGGAGRCGASAFSVLDMVRLGEPIDDHIGLELG